MDEEGQKKLTELVEQHYLTEKENVVLRQAARIVFRRSHVNPATLDVKMGKAGIYAQITVEFFQK